jgi:hypothetical protein
MKKYGMGGMMRREAERPMAEVRARRGGMGPVPVRPLPETEPVYKKGGSVKKMAGGSASKRADGIASKGKTKGKMIKMRMGGKC